MGYGRTVGNGPWSELSRPPLRETPLRLALAGGLRPAWRQVVVVAGTGSTNADLAARAAAGEPGGLVLVADHQSAGRGRLARTWTAPARSSVAVSVLLRPAQDGGVERARWAWLPLLAGVAAVDALTRTCGLPARLKWPNDVLVPDPDAGAAGKICGILAEVVGDAVVLGAGINASQGREELPPGGTSLLLAGAATTSRDTVVRAYLRALAARYQQWVGAGGDPRASGIGPAYREACATLGLPVQVRLPGADPVVGLAEEVDDEGRLVVRDRAGRLVPLAAGDVVHVRPVDGPAAS